VSIFNRTPTGTGKLHIEVLESLSAPPGFDWHDSESGVVLTDSYLVLYDSHPDSIVRVPIEAIRAATLRRGWWATLLSHFLVIRYGVEGGSRYAEIKMPRSRGEDAVMCLADAAEGNAGARFKIEPIFTPRLLGGLVLIGLFVWVAGSLRFYFRGQGPFIDVVLATGGLTAVLMVVVAMIAFGQ